MAVQSAMQCHTQWRHVKTSRHTNNLLWAEDTVPVITDHFVQRTTSSLVFAILSATAEADLTRFSVAGDNLEFYR